MTKTKLLLTAAVMLASWGAIAQEKGMKFFEGSWSELLAEAQRTQKPIFVDVYTVWCGPCKLMAKNIFPLESVGEKYNAGFINYKLDAEKGEGVEVANSFNVNSYPTYLYLNSSGELVYRGAGYSGTPDPFIADADKALEAARDPNTIGKMQAAYKAGERSKDFLRNYISKLTMLEMNNAEALQDYFESLGEAEKQDIEVLGFLAVNAKDATAPAFTLVMKNFERLQSAKQEMKAPGKFSMPLEYKLGNTLQMSALRVKEEKKYDQLITIIRYAEKLPKLHDYLVAEFQKLKMDYFGATGQKDSLIKTVKAFVKPYESATVQEIRKENDRQFEQWYELYRSGKADSTRDESFSKTREYFSRRYIMDVVNNLGSAAMVVSEHMNDKAILKPALGWNEKAISLDPGQSNLQLTSASLMNKLGNKKKAASRIKMLLTKAKASGDQRSAELFENFLTELK